ncbi:MAG: carboxypeptidase regulatory-like domain-containing protein [Bryobacterales bacterium]|nr:carboxypeptidase regulatory-like domain-containing protein [Bryobacterales bacterium]
MARTRILPAGMPLATALLAYLLLALPLPAQEVTATITGLVKDASGAAVAGADVVATHTETGAQRRVKTLAEGEYTLTALQIGSYSVDVTAAGFKPARQQDILLHIGDRIRADFKLNVGDITQTIEVADSATLVSTESSEQGGIISGEQVRELQLNGRSFMSLIELMPGVSSDLPDRVDPNTPPNISINGARSSASAFSIDGGTNSDVIVGSGSLNTFTSVDTIAEFKVVTSTFAAEYGRGGFSQVNVVTRGGTKNYKGSAYYFHRNDIFDARDYLTRQVLPLKLNNFGYNLHGPLRFPGYNKDRRKTFFFWTQEFNRIHTRGEAVNTQVPEPGHRNGDFSNLAATAVIDPDTLAPWPDRKIPASRIDPSARKLLALYPEPNFRGPGTLNYTSAAGATQFWREYMLRLDHNFSDSFRIYGRVTFDISDVKNPYGGWQTTQVTTRFPGLNSTEANVDGRNVNLNITKVLGVGWLSETVATYSARRITLDPANPDVDRKALGIDLPKLFENGNTTIPNLSLGGNYAVLNIGRPWLKNLFNFDVSSNMTRVAGAHTVKMGVVVSYGGNRENPTGPLTNGQYAFTTNFSRHPVANALLGLPNTYSEAERAVVSHARFAMAEAFLQDDFRIHPRLTLNYGVRYSSYINPWDTENVLTNFLPSRFDPARAVRINPANGQRVPNTGDPLNGIIIAGQNSPFGKFITNNLHGLFAPRFGFAWDVTGRKRTAVRGGYGINYTRPLIGSFINNAFDNAPFNRSVTINLPPFADPSGGGTLAGEPAPSLTVMASPLAAPYVQQWGIGVEHELARRSLIKISYVANKGTHLLRPLNLNNPEPRPATNGINVNAVRPFAGYGSITERQPTANSNYNSLQVNFTRRLARRFTVTTAYTFSKSIDNASSDRGGSDVPPNTKNAAIERGVSDFDRTHILTASYIFESPRITRHRMAGFALNGWQISGITRINSGPPFDVVMSQDVAGIGGTQNQRPLLIAPVTYPRTVEQWFSVASFGRPASGTFGNLGRNSLRRPGINRWDASMMKNFYLDETRRYFQFRAEFFNAPNHPSFTTLGTALTTTNAGVDPTQNSFGAVTGSRDARVLQFALKLYF